MALPVAEGDARSYKLGAQGAPACDPGGLSFDWGGACFPGGHIVRFDDGSAWLEVWDWVSFTGSGTYCQDIDVDDICDATCAVIALRSCPCASGTNPLFHFEAYRRHCGLIWIESPLDMTPRAEPEWHYQNWDPTMPVIILLDAPGAGLPTNCESARGAVSGEVRHS